MVQRADDADGQAAANAKEHIANLADRVVGKQFFHVLLDKRHGNAKEQRDRADDQNERAHCRTRLNVVNLRDDHDSEADTENFFQRAGERREKRRGRVLRRQRDPAVERHGARLTHGAKQHKRAARRAESADRKTGHGADVGLAGNADGDDYAEHQQ